MHLCELEVHGDMKGNPYPLFHHLEALHAVAALNC